MNFRHVSRNSKRIYQTVKKNFVSEKERKDDFLRNTFCGSLPPRIFLKTQPLFSPTDKLVLQQGVSEIFAVHIWARGNPCLIFTQHVKHEKQFFTSRIGFCSVILSVILLSIVYKYINVIHIVTKDLLAKYINQINRRKGFERKRRYECYDE